MHQNSHLRFFIQATPRSQFPPKSSKSLSNVQRIAQRPGYSPCRRSWSVQRRRSCRCGSWSRGCPQWSHRAHTCGSRRSAGGTPAKCPDAGRSRHPCTLCAACHSLPVHVTITICTHKQMQTHTCMQHAETQKSPYNVHICSAHHFKIKLIKLIMSIENRNVCLISFSLDRTSQQSQNKI